MSGWLDRWREILDVLMRRKLRTALTALSVAWGIFMLVLLLAAGQGLENGARREFQRNAHNSLYVFPGRLAKPHQGNPIGKVVQLRNDDRELPHRTFPNVEQESARTDVGNQVVRRGARSSSFIVKGCLPDNADIEQTNIVAGRFISAADVRERRKVAAIGTRVRQVLFADGSEPIGAEIEIGRVVFRVVGVIEEEVEQNEQDTLYIPLGTAQLVWGRTDKLDRILFTLGAASSGRIAEEVQALRGAFSGKHGFARDDLQALFVWSSDEQFQRVQGLLNGIRTFIWLIGLGTILAGVVGVSNIMMISVQERTREIGVRKAVGAPPLAIILMVIQEALAITLVSGYLGLVAAVGAVRAIGAVIPPSAYFRHPDVDLAVGLAATVVLAFTGTMAGLFPALQAARVNPIRALRAE